MHVSTFIPVVLISAAMAQSHGQCDQASAYNQVLNDHWLADEIHFVEVIPGDLEFDIRMKAVPKRKFLTSAEYPPRDLADT